MWGLLWLNSMDVVLVIWSYRTYAMRAYDFNFSPNANKLCNLIVPHICTHLVHSKGHTLTNWIFRHKFELCDNEFTYSRIKLSQQSHNYYYQWRPKGEYAMRHIYRLELVEHWKKKVHVKVFNVTVWFDHATNKFRDRVSPFSYLLKKD